MWGSWIGYFYDSAKRLQQRVFVARLNTEGKPEPIIECLPWVTNEVSHDQSSLTPAADGGMHVIGTDIHRGPLKKKAPGEEPDLLYAKIAADGQTCMSSQRLPGVGVLPQLAETVNALVVVGPGLSTISTDGGRSFCTPARWEFGDKLARLAGSPDRKNIYVVGDSDKDGLRVSVSGDSGRTWRRPQAPLKTDGTARAWRYPAIAVDRMGRVHIVWIEDGEGFGAVYHAVSLDQGNTFSRPTRVSDQDFPFSPEAPYPPPVTQAGTWIGDYNSVTVVEDTVIVAWSDQRAGPALSTVYVAVGTPP